MLNLQANDMYLKNECGWENVLTSLNMFLLHESGKLAKFQNIMDDDPGNL